MDKSLAFADLDVDLETVVVNGEVVVEVEDLPTAPIVDEAVATKEIIVTTTGPSTEDLAAAKKDSEIFKEETKLAFEHLEKAAEAGAHKIEDTFTKGKTPELDQGEIFKVEAKLAFEHLEHAAEAAAHEIEHVYHNAEHEIVVAAHKVEDAFKDAGQDIERGIEAVDHLQYTEIAPPPEVFTFEDYLANLLYRLTGISPTFSFSDKQANPPAKPPYTEKVIIGGEDLARGVTEEFILPLDIDAEDGIVEDTYTEGKEVDTHIGSPTLVLPLVDEVETPSVDSPVAALEAAVDEAVEKVEETTRGVVDELEAEAEVEKAESAEAFAAIEAAIEGIVEAEGELVAKAEAEKAESTEAVTVIEAAVEEIVEDEAEYVEAEELVSQAIDLSVDVVPDEPTVVAEVEEVIEDVVAEKETIVDESTIEVVVEEAAAPVVEEVKEVAAEVIADAEEVVVEKEVIVEETTVEVVEEEAAAPGVEEVKVVIADAEEGVLEKEVIVEETTVEVVEEEASEPVAAETEALDVIAAVSGSTVVVAEPGRAILVPTTEVSTTEHNNIEVYSPPVLYAGDDHVHAFGDFHGEDASGTKDVVIKEIHEPVDHVHVIPETAAEVLKSAKETAAWETEALKSEFAAEGGEKLVEKYYEEIKTKIVEGVKLELEDGEPDVRAKDLAEVIEDVVQADFVKEVEADLIPSGAEVVKTEVEEELAAKLKKDLVKDIKAELADDSRAEKSFATKVAAAVVSDVKKGEFVEEIEEALFKDQVATEDIVSKAVHEVSYEVATDAQHDHTHFLDNLPALPEGLIHDPVHSKVLTKEALASILASKAYHEGPTATVVHYLPIVIKHSATAEVAEAVDSEDLLLDLQAMPTESDASAVEDFIFDTETYADADALMPLWDTAFTDASSEALV